MPSSTTKTHGQKARLVWLKRQEVTMSNSIVNPTAVIANPSITAEAAKVLAEAAKAQAAAATEAFVQKIIAELDGLSVNCGNWEKGAFKKANEELYALLAQCLSIFEARFLAATDADRAALRKAIVARLQAKGVRVVKQSATLTMFVRWVFNSDRKRANSYAYVLAAAISHGVRSDGLALWITEQGGIEEVKRRFMVKPETQQRQAELAQTRERVVAEIAQALDAPLAEVALGGLSGEYVLLLAKPNESGSGAAVVGVLSDASESMRKSLVQQVAKQRYEQMEAQAQVAREAAALTSRASNDALGVRVA